MTVGVRLRLMLCVLIGPHWHGR